MGRRSATSRPDACGPPTPRPRFGTVSAAETAARATRGHLLWDIAQRQHGAAPPTPAGHARRWARARASSARPGGRGALRGHLGLPGPARPPSPPRPRSPARLVDDLRNGNPGLDRAPPTAGPSGSLSWASHSGAACFCRPAVRGSHSQPRRPSSRPLPGRPQDQSSVAGHGDRVGVHGRRPITPRPRAGRASLSTTRAPAGKTSGTATWKAPARAIWRHAGQRQHRSTGNRLRNANPSRPTPLSLSFLLGALTVWGSGAGTRANAASDGPVSCSPLLGRVSHRLP